MNAPGQLQTIQQPLEFSTVEIQAGTEFRESRSAVRVKDLAPDELDSGPMSRRFLAVAVDHTADGGLDRAERAIAALESALDGRNDFDTVTQLRAGFRAANAELYTVAPGDVSMVALLSNDKYATIASVGQNEALLLRAKRWNQVTRDLKTQKSRSRRASDATEVVTPPRSGFLGRQERLDSQQPRVYDITLLPQDIVALVTWPLAETLMHSSPDLSASTTAQALADGIRDRVDVEGREDAAAVLLEVLPIRERQAVVAPAATPGRSILPYVIIGLIALAAIAAVLLLVL